ncbi:MAG TPA: DUF3471 domain-containing protein [Chitinophagaceae bacterium]|nr:DUF3471 domain-containing protein [Chitinophagaceae bacterium]
MKKILFFLLLPLGLSAQKNYAELLEQYMQAQANVKGFMGTVQVTQQGKDLLKKAYGTTDAQWNLTGLPTAIVHTDSVGIHYHVWHTDTVAGNFTHFSRFANEDITIIVRTAGKQNVDFIGFALADILFDIHVEFPYVHKEVPIDPALLDRYVGKYSAGLTLQVIKKDGKLYRHRDGTPDVELKPESNTKFFYSDGSDRQLEFEVDKDGKVTKIWFLNSGQKGEMKKIE